MHFSSRSWARMSWQKNVRSVLVLGGRYRHLTGPAGVCLAFGLIFSPCVKWQTTPMFRFKQLLQPRHRPERYEIVKSRAALFGFWKSTLHTCTFKMKDCKWSRALCRDFYLYRPSLSGLGPKLRGFLRFEIIFNYNMGVCKWVKCQESLK
jgi:hypothetical protein